MGNEKCFFQAFPAILFFFSLFVEAKKRKQREKLPISKSKQGEPGNCLSIDLNFSSGGGSRLMRTAHLGLWLYDLSQSTVSLKTIEINI
jgi:hypothetical protein